MIEHIFVIGGCRSGKSSYAQKLAEKTPARERIFLATCIPQDDEMSQRVCIHRQQRGRQWTTLEVPLELPEAIVAKATKNSVVLVDCLTLWVNNLLMQTEDTTGVAKRIPKLITALKTAQCPVILVSNEVGTGIVPENKLARMFRDTVGSLNQTVAMHADKVVWVVSGIPVPIKG